MGSGKSPIHALHDVGRGAVHAAHAGGPTTQPTELTTALNRAKTIVFMSLFPLMRFIIPASDTLPPDALDREASTTGTELIQ